jgi:streptogramin lyase
LISLRRPRWAGLAVLALLSVSSASASAAPIGQIEEFATPTAASQPQGIVAGPDGKLWLTEANASKIAEVNSSTHAISEFSTPTPNSFPLGITMGPDGKLWFTEFAADKIGTIDPTTHAISEFPIPTASAGPVGIAAGPDGDLWFAESTSDKIAAIDPATDAITEIAVPTSNSGPFGVGAGPDGNIWFTEKAASKIGVVNLTTNTITEIPTPTPSAMPNAIAAGPDGSLWFTESASTASKIGLIDTTTRTITEFPTPTSSSSPVVIAPAADGNMWFTEGSASKIGMINPVTHTIAEFSTPTASAGPVGIAPGADGNLWFTENTASKVGLVGAGAPAASLAAPSIAGTPQPGDQLSCQGALWSVWAGQQPSLSGFGFDGYRWLRDGSSIAGAVSQSYTPVTADIGHQISCRLTVTYPLLSTTTSAVSSPVIPIPLTPTPLTPPPLGATLTSISTSGATATLRISCAGAPNQVCQGPITLSSHVTTQAGKTDAVATRPRSKPEPKVTKLESVAGGSYTVSAGQSATVELPLNSTGVKLLDQLYRLPTTLTIAGTSAIVKSIVFTYGRLHVTVGATWKSTKGYSSIVNLTLSGLPSAAKIMVVCHGHGCPFFQRSATSPKHGKLTLTHLFQKRHLSPHGTVELEITATNDIGEVTLFTINSGKQPTRAPRCLPPGTRTPTFCA